MKEQRKKARTSRKLDKKKRKRVERNKVVAGNEYNEWRGAGDLQFVYERRVNDARKELEGRGLGNLDRSDLHNYSHNGYYVYAVCTSCLLARGTWQQKPST